MGVMNPIEAASESLLQLTMALQKRRMYELGVPVNKGLSVLWRCENLPIGSQFWLFKRWEVSWIVHVKSDLIWQSFLVKVPFSAY